MILILFIRSPMPDDFRRSSEVNEGLIEQAPRANVTLIETLTEFYQLILEKKYFIFYTDIFFSGLAMGCYISSLANITATTIDSTDQSETKYIGTGITGTAPQNRSAASIAPAASGGLDVLSRAASLQQPSGGAQEPPRGSSSVADAPVPVPAANGAAASGEEPASKEQGGPAEDMAAGLQPTRQSKEAAAAAPAPEPSATAEAEDGAEVQ